jgi:hypothetical protein
MTQKKLENDELTCRHLLQEQPKKNLVKKPRRKMYLHSSKYDRSCAPTTIAPKSMITPASSNNNCSNNNCSSKHVETAIEAQLKP